MTDKKPPTATEVRAIKTEHEAVVQGYRDTLAAAIRCGDLLRVAKDKIAHGKWTVFVTETIGIPERTASYYMRLSEKNKNGELQDRADENGNELADLSLTAANELIKKPPTEKQLAARAVAGERLKASRKSGTKTKPASSDLKSTFENVGVDEVWTGLKEAGWDLKALSQLSRLIDDYVEERSNASTDEAQPTVN